MRRFGRATVAVSPVIGTVLILMIVVFAIGGILVWGVPAIQGLQRHAEFQSVQTQMLELNQDVRNLRDPQNTRLATLSIAGGQFFVNDGDRWAITVATGLSYNDTRVTLFEDDDDIINVTGPPNGDNVTLSKVTGGQFLSLDSCDMPCIGGLDLGASGNITEHVLRIQVRNSSVVKAEAWILNAGRMTYDQSAGVANLNHLELGASLVQQGPAIYLRQSPSVKEPEFEAVPPDSDYFLRVIQLSGDASISGRGDFSVLVNLVDNYGVSRGRPLFDTAYSVRYQIDGDLEEAFCNNLLIRDDFYSYDGTDDQDCPTGPEGDTDVLYLPDDDFVFEMSHAVVNTFVRAS